MKKFYVLILTVLVFSSYFVSDSYSEIVLKKSDEIRCKNIYEKFNLMGEENFRKRYPAYPIMDKCMILFHALESDLRMKDSASKQTLSDLPSVHNHKILSKQKIGPDKFLVNFNVCSEEKIGNYLKITTDKEQFVGKILRSQINHCVSFWTIMHVNDFENIHVSWHDISPTSKVTRKLF